MDAVNVDQLKKSSEHQRQREEVPTPVRLRTMLDLKNQRRRTVHLAASSQHLRTMLDLKNQRRRSVNRAASTKDLRTILDRNQEVSRLKYQRRRSITSLVSILGDSVTTSLLGGDSDATSILGNSVTGDSVTARSGNHASRNSTLGDPSSVKKKLDPPSSPRQIRNSNSGKARTFTSDLTLPVVKRSDSSPTKKELNPSSSTLPVHLGNDSNGHISRSRRPGSASATLFNRDNGGSGHTRTFKSAKNDFGDSSTKKTHSSLSTNGTAFAIKKSSSFSRDGSPVHVSTSRRPGCATATEAYRSNSGSDHTRTSKTGEGNGETSSTKKTFSSSVDDDSASATKKTSSFLADCSQDSAPVTQARKSNCKHDHARSSERRKSIGSASSTENTYSSSFDCSLAIRYEVGDTRIRRGHSISFDSSTQAFTLLAQLPLKYPLFVRRSNQKFTYSILVGRIDSGDDGGVNLVVALDKSGKLEKVLERRYWVTCLRLVNSRMVNYEH